jgi:light-regulated signal transduction histidine kinase (bacteriophytochrome)
MRLELDRADRELQTFTAAVSHDLRWPLRVIMGFSGILKQDLDAGLIDEATQHADRIDRAARRMDGMLKALARLARVNHRTLDISAVDMAKLAREAWALVTAEEPARHASLLIADLPLARGDHQLLAHVWENLLANADKYTARTQPARIKVDAFDEDGRSWYRVSDNGVGFDTTLASNLFEPFRRLHSDWEFPGTGLGLNIVRRVIRRHGGEIRARGEVGAGAVFEFTLEPGQAADQAGAASAA